MPKTTLVRFSRPPFHPPKTLQESRIRFYKMVDAVGHASLPLNQSSYETRVYVSKMADAPRVHFSSPPHKSTCLGRCKRLESIPPPSRMWHESTCMSSRMFLSLLLLLTYLIFLLLLQKYTPEQEKTKQELNTVPFFLDQVPIIIFSPRLQKSLSLLKIRAGEKPAPLNSCNNKIIIKRLLLLHGARPWLWLARGSLLEKVLEEQQDISFRKCPFFLSKAHQTSTRAKTPGLLWRSVAHFRNTFICNNLPKVAKKPKHKSKE